MCGVVAVIVGESPASTVELGSDRSQASYFRVIKLCVSTAVKISGLASDAMSTDHVERRETTRDYEPELESEPNPAHVAGVSSGIQSPERDAPMDSHAVLQQSRYPMNSRRLTATHLRAIAEAIGLPSAGSVDQLRQCIEGKLQTERDDPNIVVVIREVQSTDHILALADSEGEFIQTLPLGRGRSTYRGGSTSHELQEARAQLQEAERVVESAKVKDMQQAQQIAELQVALHEQEEQITERFEDEVAELKQKILDEKAKLRRSWKTNCEHLAEQDAMITAQDEEIRELKRKLAQLAEGGRDRRDGTSHHRRGGSATLSRAESPLVMDEGSVNVAPDASRPTGTGDHTGARVATVVTPSPLQNPSQGDGRGDEHAREPVHHDRSRRGKAPPIEFFSGEEPAILLEDWLPSLERAAAWNGWSVQDKLIQLPGYLKGRALQEWHLLSCVEQQSYQTAVDALESRLDPRNRTMAAQEFRHSIQRQGESVAEFIRRIEKAYQVAYGKDSLLTDTRDALLYSQLYNGLRYEIMQGPAVSGSQSYRELCVAAKGEEHRLAALHQRQQLKSPDETPVHPRESDSGQAHSDGTTEDVTSPQTRKQALTSTTSETQVICYNCGKPGHMSRNCRQRRQESKGRPASQAGSSQMKQVYANGRRSCNSQENTSEQDAFSFLYSDSDDETAKAYTVRVADGGSIHIPEDTPQDCEEPSRSKTGIDKTRKKRKKVHDYLKIPAPPWARTQTTPPTRLMSVKTRLEVEPSWRRGVM